MFKSHTILIKSFYLILYLLFLSVSGCGGSSGGQSTDDQTTTWSPGVFKSDTLFVGRCENPRRGASAVTGRIFTDRQGTVLDENNWLRSWSNDRYLWYSEILDQDPAGFDIPLTYFQELKTKATTVSGKLKDRFHFTVPTDMYEQQTQAGVSFGYGASYVLLSSTPPRELVIAYTEPNSPAASKVFRGTKILEVDGVDFVNANTQAEVAIINAGLSPASKGETHTFKVQDVNSSTTRTVNVTSSTITSQPVQNVKTIITATGKVGYFLFNAHIATAEAQLIDAVSQFKDEAVSDLILDLRYNGGGSIYIALELGSMIAGNNVSNGQVVGTLKFNDKHSSDNVSAPFITHTPSFSANPNQLLPLLNLSRVFVLTGPNTCSASELIINGLRGVDIEVIQIGTTTCGKPYGFNTRDNCGTSYFSVNFKTENAKGFSDYAEGFSPLDTFENIGVPLPGCSVKDDFTHALGDSAEARLKTALFYRTNNTCPDFSAVAKGASPLSAVDGEFIQVEWLKNMIMTKHQGVNTKRVEP